MVTTRATLSATAAVVPVPGLDIRADVSLLLAMKLLGNSHVDDCFEVAKRALQDMAKTEPKKLLESSSSVSRYRLF
ncbi:hypothetical protein PV762_27005 [Mitsuaria sp. CC2]|uniref:hypothetical protein n=1 Tax=Mitsuaria sp. CC2 TaxID=3029186 RepID=UPI003B8B5431